MARSGYKYRLGYQGKWRFELLPNNNNTQPVAKSDGYDSKEQVLLALQNFKEYLRTAEHEKIKIEFCKASKDSFQNKHYACFEISPDGKKIYTRRYQEKSQPKLGIERIFKNFDVPIRDDLCGKGWLQ